MTPAAFDDSSSERMSPVTAAPPAARESAAVARTGLLGATFDYALDLVASPPPSS